MCHAVIPPPPEVPVETWGVWFFCVITNAVQRCGDQPARRTSSLLRSLMMGVDRFKAKSGRGRVRPGALLTLAVTLSVVAAACSSGGEKSGGSGGGAGLERPSEAAREGKDAGEVKMPNGTDPGSERSNGVTPGISVRIGAAKRSTGRGVTKTMPKDVGKQGERDGEEGDENENERAPITPLASDPKIRTGRPTIAPTAPASHTA